MYKTIYIYIIYYIIITMSNFKKKTIFIKKKMSNIFYKGKFIPITILEHKNISFNLINLNKNYSFHFKSKGKGFSGTIKRYGFSSNYATHGNSKAHRKQGSIGMCQDPGRVIKGKKMPGRLGGNNIKINNIKIIYFDSNKIFLKGSFPGSYNQRIFSYDIF
ncbi:50S ribosomal protein L3 [Candidatus Vidania fulgoroideorum]